MPNAITIKKWRSNSCAFDSVLACVLATMENVRNLFGIDHQTFSVVYYEVYNSSRSEATSAFDDLVHGFISRKVDLEADEKLRNLVDTSSKFQSIGMILSKLGLIVGAPENRLKSAFVETVFTSSRIDVPLNGIICNHTEAFLALNTPSLGALTLSLASIRKKLQQRATVSQFLQHCLRCPLGFLFKHNANVIHMPTADKMKPSSCSVGTQ